MNKIGETIQLNLEGLRWTVLYNDNLIAVFVDEQEAIKYVKIILKKHGNRRGRFDIGELVKGPWG